MVNQRCKVYLKLDLFSSDIVVKLPLLTTLWSFVKLATS